MAVTDFLNGLPLSGLANRSLLRDALVKRVIYPFASSEDPATWTAAVSGSVPVAIATSGGGLAFLDPLDASTPHDGITVIRTADNYCYKVSNMTMPDSVLAPLGKVEPDGDEEIGDAYIVNDAPDGDFATFGGMIAVLTIRGWLAIEPRKGRPVLVEGAGHYYRDASGLWLPVWSASTHGVRDEDVNGGVNYRIVETSALNAPPVSHPAGSYWRVGGSPTGAWAGHADELATFYEGDSDWSFITPYAGLRIYDKAAASTLLYNGTSWEPQNGAIIKSDFIYVASPAATQGGSGSYGPMDATTEPTLSQAYTELSDYLTIQTQAGRRIDVTAAIVPTNSSSMMFALFVDNIANAVASEFVDIVANRNKRVTFRTTALDSLPHVYKFRSVAFAGVATRLTTTNYRFFFEYKVFS